MSDSAPATVTLADLADRLGGRLVAASHLAARVVRGGYASDLLSDVMAHADEGDAWVTMQKHINIVAVAQLKNLAVIVIVNDRQPDADTLARAASEDVAVILTPRSAFDAAGTLYELGIRGSRTS